MMWCSSCPLLLPPPPLLLLLLLLQIFGRSSVDIIKSGGFKISALDIEGALLHHPAVAEAAVLGLPDDSLGEVVAALIVPKAAAATAAAAAAGTQPSSNSSSSSDDMASDDALLGQLKGLARRELPSYSLPRVWRLLDAPLPRNAMGKVNKKELLRTFFPEHTTAASSAAGSGGSGVKQAQT
jgi:malonyl-CoA/methylmalonyl-CoA synthetase